MTNALIRKNELIPNGKAARSILIRGYFGQFSEWVVCILITAPGSLCHAAFKRNEITVLFRRNLDFCAYRSILEQNATNCFSFLKYRLKSGFQLKHCTQENKGKSLNLRSVNLAHMIFIMIRIRLVSALFHSLFVTAEC